MARFGHLLGARASGPLPAIDVCLFGLGNPGPQYGWSRHNAGWLVLDTWAARYGHRLKWQEKGPAQVAAVQDGANTFLLVKPTTFMNLSGRAATWIKRHYCLARFLVLHDEMDCAFGKFKFAAEGGPGGHNGLKSLIAELETRQFDRFKIGISHRGEEIGSDYVLESFNREEL
ncbi:MAG: aminoacyl-tRNA hydrolase, partial [bacterium]